MTAEVCKCCSYFMRDWAFSVYGSGGYFLKEVNAPDGVKSLEFGRQHRGRGVGSLIGSHIVEK